jgi:type IV secretory pathway protease TraF
MAEGQVLLMSEQNPRSFDARYFGPVDGRLILGALRPVLTLRR